VWRGASADIHKVYQEGKPLIVEGTLDYSHYLETTFEPSQECLDNARKFIKGELDIDDLGIRETIKLFNGDAIYHQTAEVGDLSWMAEEANAPELGLLKKMKEIKDKRGILLPILVIINKRDHEYIITEYVNR
jgi:hypothetical protein